MSFKQLLAAFCVAATFSVSANPGVTLLEEKRSLYQTVKVFTDSRHTCISFKNRRARYDHYQSCVNKKDPNKLWFDYFRAVVGLAATQHTNPKRILVIGGGGGVIPMSLNKIFPRATVDAVEIDPVVVEMAVKYFDYPKTSDGSIKTHIVDGRVFVKRAELKKLQYDIVILDAFGSDYIPAHLMTQEFLKEVKSILSVDGIVLSNTFSDSKLYDHESATYESVFGGFLQVNKLTVDANRVIFAGNRILDLELAKQNITNRANLLRPFSIDADVLLEKLSYASDWNTDARVLTDQYSPVNLLK